ncbi:MAG: DUF2283 domain-containing protein [Candidatus Undinarchaeales archaeon]|jgi:uncharacterized protein YuzE|nr:DUF2283 domain-containing protein [Candidatus Undinarchaeales archaeon]
MKLNYDKEANAAYIYLKESIGAGEVKRTISMNQEINLDFSANNQLLGIEILNAKKYLPDEVISTRA